MDNKADKRIFGLDLIRALAIIFVMIIHAGAFIPPKFHSFYSLFIFDGVSVFFVLSGFLIGNILIKQLEYNGLTREQIKIFWLKRWSRTLPSYYMILIILTIFDLLYSNQDINYFSYFFFTQNLFTNIKHGFFEWSWSLAVEEWFYLLLPIFIWAIYLFSKSIKNTILVVIIFTISFVNINRLLVLSDYQKLDFEVLKIVQYSVYTRLDGIIYGVLAAYIYNYNNKFWQKNKVMLLAIGLIVSILNFIFMKVFNYKVNYLFRIIDLGIFPLSIFCFLPYFNDIKQIKNIYFYKFITFISTISYSLYLINNIVSNIISKIIQFVTVYLENNRIEVKWSIFFATAYFSFWGLSILLSNIFYKHFEKKTINYFRIKILK